MINKLKESLMLYYIGWVIVFGLVGNLMTGCSTPRDYQKLSKQEVDVGLERFEDKKHNVVCWIYNSDGDGPAMSCLKVTELSRETK